MCDGRTDLVSVAHVKDASGAPLVGVTILEKGSQRGTTTNAKGEYTIRIKNDNTDLVFSMLGYVSQELRVGKRTVLDVSLAEDTSEIDEVVVVGYGYVRRVDLTGSVASVNTEEMQKAPVRSFDEALAGRVAGVQVTSSEGEPGSSVNIIVRGQNSLTQDSSPLYVVDGFPLESFNASSLNPSDIVSIDVLKDASATAIYGARGANGVIMITTRSGHAGRTQVSYEGSFGLQNTTNRMDLMNPYEFVKLQLEIDPYQGRKSYLKPNSDGLDTRTPEYYRHVQYVDWQERVLQVAPMHNHTVSLTGGSKAVKYAASLNYMGQEGVVRQSGPCREAMSRLREFMFENVYRNPVAKGEESKAQDMLRRLFECYVSDPDRLPPEFQDIREREGVERAVCDYIAGMTDKYAVEKFSEAFIPMSWGVK